MPLLVDLPLLVDRLLLIDLLLLVDLLLLRDLLLVLRPDFLDFDRRCSQLGLLERVVVEEEDVELDARLLLLSDEDFLEDFL